MAKKKTSKKSSKKNPKLYAKCKKWAKKNKSYIKTGLLLASATAVGCIFGAVLGGSDSNGGCASGSGSNYDVI